MIKNDQIQLLDIKNVYPDPNQPRQFFDPSKLEELKNSILKHSQLVPIAVIPSKNKNQYIIIDGERRYRACKALGLKTIKAIIHEQTDLKASQVSRFQIQEKTLAWTGLDRAKIILNLVRLEGGNQEAIGQELGLTKNAVREYLTIAQLSTEQQNAIFKLNLPISLTRIIIRASNKITDKNLCKQFIGATLNRLKEGEVIPPAVINQINFGFEITGDKLVKQLLKTKKTYRAFINGDQASKAEQILNRLNYNVSYTANLITRLKSIKGYKITRNDLNDKLKDKIKNAGEVLTKFYAEIE